MQEDPLSLLDRVHRGADIRAHAEILFGGLRVAERPFLPIFLECMAATGTTSVAWKVLRRALRAYQLARYVESAARLGGAMAECGVFNGLTALLACRVRRMIDPGFRGADFFLVDSYEGLSESREQDLIDVMGKGGRIERVPSHQAGHFAVDVGAVRSRFADFPEASFVKGWIPQVLPQLPERKYAFVHIDVDLYEPTRGALEYFQPRMLPGGIIVNDDFSTPLFPGAGKAWIEHFDRTGAPYVVLDTGQSVYVAPVARPAS